MIFALAIVPIVTLTGFAIDVGTISHVRSRLTQSLDATALAVGSDPRITQSNAQTLGEQFFLANFQSEGLSIPVSVHVTVSRESVVVSGRATVETMFMGFIGRDDIEVEDEVEVVRAGEDLELVMVLDNTGSMSGSRINALRAAANSAVRILFEGAPVGEDRLLIGLVPFSSTVNVGDDFERDWWLDPDGRSSVHAPTQNFDRAVNRWDLFDALRQRWAGCVEARPSPYDLDDTPPNPSDPDTLFVPYFAPDEPGNAGRPRRGYSNSYLNDSGGGSNANRQAHAAKYTAGGRLRGGGPNNGCTARPIIAMTDDQETLEDAIDAMTANGTTNIHNAVSWGLRVLSPEAPYTEGRPFTEERLVKAMIVLTDGENYIGTNSSHNMSHYTGYGYVAEGRLGVTSSNYSVVHNEMNRRTEEACRIARETGVRVYTITFQVSDRSTRELMEACASVDDDGRPLYWDSPSNQALEAAFEDIARDLTLLRVAR